LAKLRLHLDTQKGVGGVQYVSIRYDRLADAGIEPSVGRVGDSCDNALAETINACSRPRSSTDARHGARSKP
jgi:transposase InsO family protein